MSTQLEILDAKNHLAELVDRARSGEEIILADAGKPVVKLGPAQTSAVEGTAEPIRTEFIPAWKIAWRRAAGSWKNYDEQKYPNKEISNAGPANQSE